MNSILKSFSVLLILVFISEFASARTFTDTLGRKIEAILVKVEKNQVTLQLEDSKKNYLIPVGRLSQEDRDYVESWAKKKSNPKPHEHASWKGESISTKKLKEIFSLKDNFDAPFPKTISISINQDINIIEENKTKKRFVYHSPNFEFISDVRLSKNVIKKFAVMFEATREFCRQLPISTLKAHVPGATFKNPIYIFEHKSTYHEKGGPEGSAGVFTQYQGRGVVLVPAESAGLKKVGSGYMYDYKKSNKTLRHELVHQLTDHEYISDPASRGWFSEGLAEYCANTPYRSGKYMLSNNISSIKAYVTKYGKDGRGGRGLGDDFVAPHLKDFFLMPYSEFMINGSLNYGLGLLLTYYFFHMEEDRSNIIHFLKALKEGKKGEQALEVLLNSRNYNELENDISKAWRSRGVRIRFK